MSHHEQTPSTTTDIVVEEPPERCWRNLLERLGNWLAYKDRSEWLKDMRGSLSMVASLMATITFQSAVNPPGGVAQIDGNKEVKCSPTNNTLVVCPGEAVLAILSKDEYIQFMVYNTICFIASMSVCLLLVSGLPLNHRFPTWLLSIGMCIAITSLALTYLFGALMVTPDAVYGSVLGVFGTSMLVWIALFGIVSFLIITRFVVRGVNACMEK